MNRITLTNTFHNTKATVIVAADNPADAWYEIQLVYSRPHPTSADKARLRRVKKALCGVSGCECGTYRPY